MEKLIKLTNELSNAFGPSGFEDNVLEVIKENTKFATHKRDSINNLYLNLDKKDNTKPTVLLDCHSDEVGFIVSNINKNGTISFLQLGGWYVGNISSQPVIIKNKNGEFIKGIMGSKPVHFMTTEEMARLPKLDEMYIDIGSTSYEETLSFGIEIGSPIAPDVQSIYNEKTKVFRGKALDNRVGAACLIKTMEDLKDEKLNVNLTGVFASQEEAGLRGAIVSSNRVRPDFCIVLEGSPADDTFKQGTDSHGGLKKGVQLRAIDGQMIGNPRVQKYASTMAEKNKIKYQVIAREKGATNAGKYHVSGNGIPTIVLGVPCRYVHTHYSYAALDDITATIELAKSIIKNIDKNIIENF